MSASEIEKQLDAAFAENRTLRAKLDQLQSEFAKLLVDEAAARTEAECRLDKALGALRRIATEHHPSLMVGDNEKITHAAVVLAELETAVERREWKCGECGAPFAEQIDLALHVSAHHNRV